MMELGAKYSSEAQLSMISSTTQGSIHMNHAGEPLAANGVDYQPSFDHGGAKSLI